MGRADLRRKSREKIKSQKIYNYTEEDLRRIKNNMVEMVASEFLEAVFGISVMVLHDKFGNLMKKSIDGKSREERFFDYCIDLYDSFEKGYLTLDDIRKTLEEECGTKFKREKKNDRNYWKCP